MKCWKNIKSAKTMYKYISFKPEVTESTTIDLFFWLIYTKVNSKDVSIQSASLPNMGIIHLS